MVRKIVVLLAGIVWFTVLHAQTYVPVDDSSSINFSIKNLGIKVKGSFSGLQGAIVFDPAQPEKSVFEVQVSAASVNTGNEKRDDHLRQEVFFDVKNYPHIKFVSTKVVPGRKAGTFFMEGTLTIKSISLPISFPFTVTPTTGGYWLEGKLGMRRKPFLVGRTSTISDKLTVFLRVLTKRV
ncbi:YceI family protein [Paraflavitalea soli]|nr:YceI family protein [Paraflavitalea soli]